MSLPHLTARRHWVFDLDGTLTVAIHDFDALRRELGLPAGLPVLEAVATRPPSEHPALFARIDRWEEALAEQATPAPGALALVSGLAARGARVGVLTRNTLGVARRTLEVCGLAPWFAAEDVLGRGEAPPKPSPVGVQRLLDAWGAVPDDAVMVGDFLFDLRAGRAAGAAALWVDLAGTGRYADEADATVSSLEEVAALLA